MLYEKKYIVCIVTDYSVFVGIGIGIGIGGA